MIENLLEIIGDISDKDYQIRAWIKGKGPGTDFTETTCQFFDFSEPVLSNYKIYDITEHQHSLLEKFYNHLNEFSQNNSGPPDFIDSLEWQEIMDEAKAVLTAFHYPQ
jgi:hypothetical protein